MKAFAYDTELLGYRPVAPFLIIKNRENLPDHPVPGRSWRFWKEVDLAADFMGADPELVEAEIEAQGYSIIG